MKLYFAAKTDVGLKRKVNEDCVYVNENIGLCAVADGMGGHSAGDVASRMVIDIVEESFSDFEPTDDESIREALNETIQLANYAVKTSASQNPEQRGMGSTITLLFFFDDKYFIAQVGDSRAYLIRDNQIYQITEDHSLVQQELDKGLITEEEAEEHVFKNIITRAVGIKDEVEVDFYLDRIMEGDLLLLCTDGLTNKISNLDLLKEITESDSIESSADNLVDLANARDGSDNISVVLVSMGSPFKEKSYALPAAGSKKWLMIPVIGIVVLAVIASLYFFFFRKDDTAVQVAKNVPTESVLPDSSFSSDSGDTPRVAPTAKELFDLERTTYEGETSTEPGSGNLDTRNTRSSDTKPVSQHTSKFDSITSKTPAIKSTRIPPTSVPTRAPRIEPTPRPTVAPVFAGESMAAEFGAEMGDRYHEALRAFNESGVDAASPIWNQMLYETRYNYTYQIEVDTLEKSVRSSFEKYGDYNLFVLKKKGRFYVFAGLFSSYDKAAKVKDMLPEAIRRRGPMIKQVKHIRMSR